MAALPLTAHPPALCVHGLTAGYPHMPAVLRDVAFDVPPGARVGVLGPNGAGKSTLFKAMCGLLPLRRGRVTVHGQARGGHAALGYVPQLDTVDWGFPATVYDVVMMGRTRAIGWLRWADHHDHAVVNEQLARVGLSDLADRQIGKLSGGQRRRAFMARALAQDADVLLLDEPLAGVDAAAEREILAVLDGLRAQGVTVMMATHDLASVPHVFDLVLLLSGGVVAYGAPDNVFTPANVQAAYGSQVSVFTHDGHTMVLAGSR